MRKAQLEGVKVGDTIMVRERHGAGFTLHGVERLTATQAVCAKASFRIDSGIQIGTKDNSRWGIGTRYGELAPPGKVAEIKAAQAIRQRISNAVYSIGRITVTPDNLDAAEAFIAASQPKAST